MIEEHTSTSNAQLEHKDTSNEIAVTKSHTPVHSRPLSKSVDRTGFCFRLTLKMSVQVYGCNHVAIEVDDVEKAVAFYKDAVSYTHLTLPTICSV